MKLIPLTKGQFAKVDDADFEWLSQYKWCAAYCKKTKTFTAMRRIKLNGKWTTERMARKIMQAAKEVEVDHRNHETLDNQRHNLRVCTKLQNEMNKRKPKTFKTTSQYKGVHLNSKINKWKASISINNRCCYLGIYDDELDAARAYDTAAIKHYGEFSNINGV